MVGRINIDGAIGLFEGEKSVQLIDVISQVRKQPNATSFVVSINSGGGYVDEGFDIYNFLKSLGLPITTVGTGLVASIATVIFMAGDKRIVAPNTQFMIHLPMIAMDYANSIEVEAGLNSIKETENKCVQFYSKQLGLNKEAIYPLLRNETYLTEQQLVDLGFVTKQIEAKIAARAIINKPKNKTMTKTSKLKTLLKALLGEVVNKTIFSADNKELVFTELAEDAPIEVGAKATYDGQPAEGEITGADGKVYVFAGGILSEIKEPMPAEEEVTEDEIIEALTAVLEVASGLEERLAAVETETVAVKKERDEFKTKFEAATATIAKLKGSSPEPVEPIVNKNEPKKELSTVVAQWKLNKNKKK